MQYYIGSVADCESIVNYDPDKNKEDFSSDSLQLKFTFEEEIKRERGHQEKIYESTIKKSYYNPNIIINKTGKLNKLIVMD